MLDHPEKSGHGAKAALSGFRRQALYTLSQLIQEAEKDTIVQPEGKEDIALYKNEQLLRIVQVKAYSNPLRLADLEPQKSKSFLNRTRPYLETNTAIELASFGPLSRELAGWKNHSIDAMTGLKQKLEGYGFDSNQAQKILDRIEISCLNEGSIEKDVSGFLQATVTSGNPERALELLTWWILRAAEERRKITFNDLRKRLENIGRYLAERQAHHEEWFKTIKPLDRSSREIPTEDLAAEYYRGTAARFSHIEADLDVRRPELLEAIERHFQSGRHIVILHGASGQGKTSLGFRYLLDFVPDQWRFLVEAVDNRKHATSIALALADHLHAVEAPVYLLIDVAPRDQGWVTLIRELLDSPNIHILVAIRGEDLARRTVAESQLGFPASVHLNFSITEAQQIYDRLLERGNAANAFPSFTEAWNRFGGQGPLLEFVYLITQTESLRAVLTAQVARLREEVRRGDLESNALRLLHLCAIATAYEARILLRPATELLQIKDPIGTLNLFEDEYLLRVSTDRSQAESLHPVRSTILAEVLDDPTFAPASQLACEVIRLIPEEDREVFLLYQFSRHPKSANGVLAQLQSLPMTAWEGVAGVARALRWWGIRSYLDANQSVFERAKAELLGAWSLFMVSDVAGAVEDDPIESMIDLVGQANPQGASRIRELRAELTDPAGIYSFLKAWIDQINLKSTPASPAGWESWAELLFWAGRLGIEPAWPIDIESIPVGQLPIEVSAQVCQAVFTVQPALYNQLQQAHGDQLKKRFREETNTFRLDEGDNLFAHFITPWWQLVDQPQEKIQSTGKAAKSKESGKKQLDTVLNDEAVRRARLLRLLFPGKERYCTQGYGHQLNLEGGEVLYEPSHKRMSESALPLEWLVQINSTSRNLIKYEERPENWRDYAERLLRIRKTVAMVLLKLERRLVAYFKSKKPRQIIAGDLSEEEWQEALAAVEATVPLPKTAVDEWGLSSEEQREAPNKNDASINLASAFTTYNHEVLAKPLKDYTTAATGFFRAAGVVCFCHARWGREPHRRSEVENAFHKHGYDEHRVHLAKHNLFLLMQSLPAMQRGFNERLEGLVDFAELRAVSKRESALFPGLWALWYQFCEQPNQQVGSAKQRARIAFEREKSQLRTALATALDSGEGWKARILHDGFSWENQHSLVIELQLTSLLKLEESRQGFLEILGSVLGGLGNGTLRKYVLDYYWSQIIAIPSYRGQPLAAIAWFIPSMVFFNASESEGFDRSYIRLPKPFPEEQLAEFGLSVGGEWLGRQYDIAEVGFAQWVVILNHLASLTALPDGLDGVDEVGEAILNSYLRELNVELNSLVNQALNAADAFLNEFLLNPNAVEGAIVESLQSNLGFVKRYLENGKIALKDCADLSVKIQEISGLWCLLRWLTIPGTVEDIEALQEQED